MDPHAHAGDPLGPGAASYREWLSVFTFEGQTPLHGTYFFENIEDYYVSPWELDYHRSMNFDHDFLGRGALIAARETVKRAKVTLVLDPGEVAEAFGAALAFMMSRGRYRIDAGSKLVGTTFYSGSFVDAGTKLALSLVDKQYAVPGTEVELVWGENPGPSAHRMPTWAFCGCGRRCNQRHTTNSLGLSTAADWVRLL